MLRVCYMSIAYAQKNKNAVQTKRESFVSVIDKSTRNESLQRKADLANKATQRAEVPRPNNTGMPDNLKTGIESLSGFSMDNVRVHYNSSKPATVQALAYTQGTDIHVAPGQEKHLPHEAWHVAQQMAGRVSPTTNINGMPVNDNATLEHEADVMGEKAVQCKEFAKGYLTFAKDCSNDGTKQCTRADLITKLRSLGAIFNEGCTQCSYQVPDDKAPYEIWRYLVNAYENGLGPQKDDVELKVTLTYKLNGISFNSVVAFSLANKGYILEHSVGPKKCTLNKKLGTANRNGNDGFSGTHGFSDDWEANAVNSRLFGNAGDAASKLIAERGRFQCLENVKSDRDPVVIEGKYGPVT